MDVEKGSEPQMFGYKFNGQYVRKLNKKNARVAKPMVTLRIGKSLQNAVNSAKSFKQTVICTVPTNKPLG